MHETDILRFSGLTCRIQMRRVSDIWQQRHIWYNGSKKTAEPWIRSPSGPNGSFHPVNKFSDV